MWVSRFRRKLQFLKIDWSQSSIDEQNIGSVWYEVWTEVKRISKLFNKKRTIIHRNYSANCQRLKTGNHDLMVTEFRNCLLASSNFQLFSTSTKLFIKINKNFFLFFTTSLRIVNIFFCWVFFSCKDNWQQKIWIKKRLQC